MAPYLYDLSCWWDVKCKQTNLILVLKFVNLISMDFEWVSELESWSDYILKDFCRDDFLPTSDSKLLAKECKHSSI